MITPLLATAKVNRAVASYSFALVAIAFLVLLSPSVWSQSLPAEAKKAILKGDWATVLSVLEKTDLKNPDTPCRMVAAHACLARNRGNDALILFFLTSDHEEMDDWKAWTKAFAEQQPESAIAHYLQADALARTGDLAAAEQRFSRAMELNPKLALAWVGRGAARALQGKDDPAYMDLLRATQVQPDLADTHASLGCLEVMLQNAEGALASFNEALRLDPTSALAYNGRGCARYGLGKPDEAFVDFEMAATLCQALVIAEANQSFVEALVVRMADERTQPTEKPATTLEIRTDKGDPQSRILRDIPRKIRARPKKRATALSGSWIGGNAGFREEWGMCNGNLPGCYGSPMVAVVCAQNDVSPSMQPLSAGFRRLGQRHFLPFAGVEIPGNLLGYGGAQQTLNGGAVPSQSQFLDDAALRAAYEEKGFVALSIRLIRERQDLLRKIAENNRLNQEVYEPASRAWPNQITAIECTKLATRCIGVIAAAETAGSAGAVAAGLFDVAKHVADKLVDRSLTKPMRRAILKIVIAGLKLKGFKLEGVDWPGAGFSTIEEVVSAVKRFVDAKQAANTIEQVGLGLMVQQKQAQLEGALAMEMARHPETFRQRLNDLRRVAFLGAQSWSLMPQLVDSLLPDTGDNKPVMLVSQDPLRSSLPSLGCSRTRASNP